MATRKKGIFLLYNTQRKKENRKVKLQIYCELIWGHVYSTESPRRDFYGLLAFMCFLHHLSSILYSNISFDIFVMLQPSGNWNNGRWNQSM